MFEWCTALFLPSSDTLCMMVFPALCWHHCWTLIMLLLQDHVCNLNNLNVVHFVVSSKLETSSSEEV